MNILLTFGMILLNHLKDNEHPEQMKLLKMESTLHHFKLALSWIFSSPEPLGSQGELIGWP